eukprot:jgi/Botrbrau1/13096/Bobra.0187s0055.1
MYLFFLGSRAWDDCSLRLGYCFGGTNNDHSIRTHNTLSGRGPDRRQILWQNFYNHTFWNLTVTVRGRHPSLYRQPALSHVYRRSSHAANFLEYIRSGLEWLRNAKSSICRFRYIRRHLSVGAFKCRSLPWATPHSTHEKVNLFNLKPMSTSGCTP